MSWHTGRLALFDLESTGIDPHRDRIITAAVIEAGAGAKTVTHEWLLQPTIPIPQAATDIHGITNEHAIVNGRMPKSCVREIGEQLLSCAQSGLPIVGHNVVYDLTMLWAELTRHGHDALAGQVRQLRPVVDTQVLERHLDPYRPGKPNGRRPDGACGPHTLLECCRLWGVQLSQDDAHGAAADALAAGRLAWRLATDPYRFERFDTGRPVDRINPAAWPLDRLHDWQTEQYAARAENFEQYLRSKGGQPDAVIPRDWPVQDPPDGWTPDQLPEPRKDEAA